MIIAIISLFAMICIGSLITVYSYNFYKSSCQLEKNSYWQENYNEIVLYEIEILAEDLIENIISKNIDLTDAEISSKISSYLFNKKKCEKIKVEVKHISNYIEFSYKYRDKFDNELETSFCVIDYYKQGESCECYKILTAGKSEN